MLRRSFLSAGVAMMLAACANSGALPRRRDAGADARQLAKTDLDRVIEVHHREIFDGLRRLTEKLYRRNPRQWKQAGNAHLEAALAQIFETPHDWRFAALEGRFGVEALHLAFREDFAGDRVLALIAGLGGMIQTAFENKTEFFVVDDLDAQKLYNSARNVEIAVWKLSNARDAAGHPLLHSNEAGPVSNLSFEREFGKLIGSLDVLAKIIAEKNQRVLARVMQSMATAVFLPVR